MERKESEVVKDIFLHFKKKCKEQKEMVEKARKEYERCKRTCYFEDEQCIIDYAKEQLIKEEAKLEQLVKDKISIEKYMRKLRHQEEENSTKTKEGL